MADPVTIMAGVGMGASALGGVLGASGAKQSAGAKAQMYRYQAGVAKINEDIAKQNADYSRRAGEVVAQRKGMEGRANIATTAAIQGASNIDINSGSSVRVRDSIGDINRFDQSIIRSDAARRAYGYDIEAIQQKNQAGIYDFAAKNETAAGDINAMTSILGGVTSVSSKWLQAKQMGVFEGGSSSNNELLIYGPGY